ncbi:MAG: hypothetical protein Q4P65_00145 [Eubacteriales bacterium]|nr:hypothetical protein [Eubacteriales bacterium]
MQEKNLNLKAIIGICGACIAFYIGAGFATMQEIMQYQASYGRLFPVVILVCAVIYLYTNLSFATNGNRLKLERGGDIYYHYCGKYIGAFFDYFSAFFCYMCFIVMCGGANSTAMEQWGLPKGTGAIILTIAVIATAVFGLDGILNALSKLGPVIILLILVVSITSTIQNITHFSEGLDLLADGVVQPEQVGDGNPFLSGASYGGFVVLWFAAFLAEIGAKNKLKEVNRGMFMSSFFIFGAAALCCIALISQIASTGVADIPALVLANSISPVLGQIFAIIVFCGIYTTAVPLLWTGVARIATEGSKKYKIATVVGGIIGCLVALFVPYKALVNVLYGMNGYLGFIMIGFMIFRDIQTRMAKKVTA